MTHRDEHRHHEHDHGHARGPWLKRAHKDWRTWVVVALMLGAMAIYVLSDNESLQPGGEVQPSVPEAE
jgi:hypothetical protein